MSKCDTCGRPVVHKDDITVVAGIAFKSPSTALFHAPRHILCSPSRAQVIVHRLFAPVIDTRPQYDKRLMEDEDRLQMEKTWTDAWVKLQEE